MLNTNLMLFPEVLSTTRDFEIYSICQYKWMVQRIFRFSKYTYNNDLAAGKEFAKATEIMRVLYYKEGKSKEEAVAAGVKSIEEDFGAIYAEQEYKDELKTPSRLAEVFSRMVEEHPLDKTNVTPFELANGSLSVEQEVVIEIPINNPDTGKPLKLKSILDMLGMCEGFVHVVDEKTAKSVLNDHEKQTNLLRTNSQFVQYVTCVNKSNLLPEGLKATHVKVNKCTIKKNYAKNEDVVKSYEFQVDAWFQKAWWENMLFIVNEMVQRYQEIKRSISLGYNKVIFPRNYGLGCNAYYRPCSLTNHCTSGTAQNLFEEGYKQIVCDSSTNYEEIPLMQYMKQRVY